MCDKKKGAITNKNIFKTKKKRDVIINAYNEINDAKKKINLASESDAITINLPDNHTQTPNFDAISRILKVIYI